MRKVLFATTALATVAGFSAVASADVTIGGGIQWQYTSVSDDNTTRSSDTAFASDSDVTISFSSTTDSGITMSMTQNIGEGGVGTATSSISADWGTIEYSEGSGSAHAGSSYDVTAPGTSGGYGDATGIKDASGTAFTNGMSVNEAALADTETGALNYHSPSFSGMSFGIGVSHLSTSDADTSNSYGLKYSGSAGDISYNIGAANYDRGDVEASHIGFDLSMGDITVGMGQSSNKASSTDDATVTSYGIVYKVSDDLSLSAGLNKSENDLTTATTDDKELDFNSVGLVYTFAPGLTASLASHSFDYNVGG
jgi:hypothetical protein